MAIGGTELGSAATEPRTYTVREMIQALLNSENLDAEVQVALGSIKMEGQPARDVDYDPETEVTTIFA